MLSAVLGIHQTLKTHEMKYRQNVALARSLSFFAHSVKPHAELNVIEVNDTGICAVSVFIIPLLFSLFSSTFSFFSLRHPLHVAVRIISTKLMLYVGLVALIVRIWKNFQRKVFAHCLLGSACFHHFYCYIMFLV